MHCFHSLFTVSSRTTRWKILIFEPLLLNLYSMHLCAYRFIPRRYLTIALTCADPEEGQGVRTPPPPENYKNIGFLSNTGPDSLKITKLPIQHSMLGHHRPPAKRHLNGVSLAGRGWTANSGIWFLLLLLNLKKTTKKQRTKKT